MNTIIKFEHIENNPVSSTGHVELRNQKIILDSDVAILYGVQTKEINQAVKNNPNKFPNGYIFSLTTKEKTELVKNFDQFNSLKHSTSTPKAFTEKGLYMLATILKGEKATQTTVATIETYANLKNISRTINELSKTNDENKKQQLLKRAVK